MGQERQFVAPSAAVGFLEGLKKMREPEEVIVEGRCAREVELGAGEQRSQRRKSMSWQDLVRREGAVVDSLRQFPLGVLLADSSDK